MMTLVDGLMVVAGGRWRVALQYKIFISFAWLVFVLWQRPLVDCEHGQK